MTFATCYYYAFTIWFPTKIIALGMVCSLFLVRDKRKSLACKVIYPLASLLIITILLSDLIGLCFSGQYAPQINRYMRMFNSNYTYLTTTALLFFGLIMERGFVKHLFPAYCLAVEIAIAIGLIHFICLKLGIGFMPILRQDGTVNMEALAMMGGQTVNRIYGFSGEPKGLGGVICPYVFISLIMLGQGVYRINKRYHLLALFASIFVLVNTFSSAVLINFFLVIPLVMMLLPFPKISYKAAAFMTSLCIVACLWNLRNETNLNNKQPANESSYVEQMYDRTFGRAQDEMENDRQESVILEHFVSEENIINILFGWGVAQYTFHVPGQSIGRSLIPVQSGLVLTIADFGILGIVLLGYLFYIITRLLMLSIRDFNAYSTAFSVATLSSFIGSLMYGSITTCFIYLMLSLYAYFDEKEIRIGI